MRRVLLALFALAFLLRLLAGLMRGPDFVDEGYSLYATLARTWLTGGGFCYDPFVDCTIRMPLYPLLVAPFLAADAAFPWLIVLQCLVDAALVWLAYAMATELFDARAGIVAAIATALNPYAVMHASSFQETVIFNALIAVAICLLIIASRSGSARQFAAAGIVLALATLTTVRMAFLLPVAVIWAAMSGPVATPSARARRAALVGVPIVLLLGSWALRNQRLIGVPVLSTESGLSLWIANNPLTMSVLPNQSVDLVEDRAWTLLTGEQQLAIASLEADPAAQDQYYARLGWRYIATQPAAALSAGVKKAWYGWVGWLRPARDWPIQLAYALVFLPLNVLALVGLWRARHLGGPHTLIRGLMVVFLITTAVFWAHTSHRSFLHLFEVIYAASLLTKVRTHWYAPRACANGNANRR